MGTIQDNARKRGRANERTLVKKLQRLGVDDAEGVPLSGALKNLKGDIKAPSLDLLLEAKCYATTEVEGSRYIRIDLNWLAKIEKEAKDMGYARGAVVIRGKNLSRDYVVIGLEDYVKILTTSVEKPQP